MRGCQTQLFDYLGLVSGIRFIGTQKCLLFNVRVGEWILPGRGSKNESDGVSGYGSSGQSIGSH